MWRWRPGCAGVPNGCAGGRRRTGTLVHRYGASTAKRSRRVWGPSACYLGCSAVRSSSTSIGYSDVCSHEIRNASANSPNCTVVLPRGSTLFSFVSCPDSGWVCGQNGVAHDTTPVAALKAKSLSYAGPSLRGSSHHLRHSIVTSDVSRHV